MGGEDVWFARKLAFDVGQAVLDEVDDEKGVGFDEDTIARVTVGVESWKGSDFVNESQTAFSWA